MYMVSKSENLKDIFPLMETQIQWSSLVKTYCISAVKLGKAWYNRLHMYKVVMSNWKSLADLFKFCYCVLEKLLKTKYNLLSPQQFT